MIVIKGRMIEVGVLVFFVLSFALVLFVQDVKIKAAREEMRQLSEDLANTTATVSEMQNGTVPNEAFVNKVYLSLESINRYLQALQATNTPMQ